ncbi:nucleoside recognition domain-containing protein [Parasphaerochaeta coccoides]|uniref:Nucleoside transporter/FeoB GTPase Gate domain-containing protein n=1 Tax=Parasphaerochaeta coccoides (strain ATCC BAA-1237 / DSM 17374 / SPN1) TaxID=760011 RepID=F4GJ76_PARC1|nr:nucleoside recognition domain-containing protein [Parasphaerochaeta coccoides]AEC01716.1 hypothetical protein Spico_0488 [Parasphaerochaeta coccoides DSM 17374]
MAINNIQTTPVDVPVKKESFVDVFINGAKKGVGVWLNALLPGVVFGYALTQILQVSGLLGLLSKVFGPIMGIFGLPGEAIGPYLTSFFTLAGGCASAAALAANGILTGTQATIILPMLICIGSDIQFFGRMLAVADVPGKQYKVNFVISIICSIVAGFIMRFIA